MATWGERSADGPIEDDGLTPSLESSRARLGAARAVVEQFEAEYGCTHRLMAVTSLTGHQEVEARLGRKEMARIIVAEVQSDPLDRAGEGCRGRRNRR
jgi:hypothetical protein